MEAEITNKRRRKALPDWATVIISVVGALALTVVIIVALFTFILGQVAGSGAGAPSKAFVGPSEPYIARISIVGEISGDANQYYSSDSAYHHDWTIETIDTLINDDNNKGICLWLNTPGGTVYESDELYLKLMEYKEKTGRPIYAYMKQMAASGGYYIASSADEIYANRNTWTGSIGVTMGTVFDVSEFLENHGIHTDTITAGRNKAMGSYYTPLTDEQKEIYQGLVDDAYDRFVAIVAHGRKMPESDVRTLADGRIYTAAQALDNGLIDRILGEKEAEDLIKSKVDGSPEIVDCYYRPDVYNSLFSSLGSGFSIWDFLTGKAGVAPGGANGVVGGNGNGGVSGDSSVTANDSDVAAVLNLVQEQESAGVPPLKYLYTG